MSVTLGRFKHELKAHQPLIIRRIRMDYIRQNVIDWNKAQLKNATEERDINRYSNNIAQLLKGAK